MCTVGNILSSIFNPCIVCCKWCLSALGLALVFVFGLMGLDIGEDWPIILICIACLVGFIWFILMYCGSVMIFYNNYCFRRVYLNRRRKKNMMNQCPTSFRYVTLKLLEHSNLHLTQLQNFQRQSYAPELSQTCNLIDNAVLEVFKMMILYAIILTILFTMCTVFLVEEGARAVYSVGILIGLIGITLITWFAYRTATRPLGRILIQATEYKEDAFILMFSCGFGTILLSVAFAYIFFVLIYFIYRGWMIPDFKEASPETLKILGIGTSGYALGFVVPAFVYREGASILGRGVLNSIDSLIKTDKNLSFNNPYISYSSKVSYLIQSVISNQVVNLLDATICIVVLTITGFLIFSNTAELAGSGMAFKSLLAPTLYLSLNLLLQTIVQLFKTWIEEGDPTAFTMYNSRLLVVLTNIVALCVFLLMPMATILDEFSIKSENVQESVHNTELQIQSITFACVIGQLSNISLICYLEWLTSHGCQPVRNLALSSNERIPCQNVNYAEYLSGFAGLGVITIIGTTVLSVYYYAGWVGFMAAASGFICNYLIYMPILYVGAQGGDAYKLCCMALVNTIVTERLYKISWAAKTYAIYVRATSAGGSILLALCLLGCSLFYFDKSADIFMDGDGIFGIIIGAGLALAYRGWNVGAVISISKKYGIDLFKSGVSPELPQDDSILGFLDRKLTVAMKFIFFYFFMHTILMVIIGLIFGYQAITGILIGVIFVALIFMIQSLISGTSLRNSRLYLESNENLSKRSIVYNHQVYGDLYGSVIQESQNLPMIVFMFYTLLFVLALNQFFAVEGYMYEKKEE